MHIITKFKYRPEIDGLRALAVMAVVFFHVGLGFPGGFIGVDIFFVISGYLITSLIIKEIQEDRFSFTDFYERRIRRIFPAGAAMVLITLFMGWFLLLPSDFVELGKSTISQTLFSSNFYFWNNTNYFAESADLQPLLHTWSLAVEEQFYMVMPLLLWGLLKFAGVRTRNNMIIVLASIFLGSFIFSVYALPKMPAATFYLLPTRAWELLFGSLVGLIPSFHILKRPAIREFLVILGLFGMILPCFLYSRATLFPGLYAVPPCLGTALFILGASPQPDTPLPFAARLFTWRPVIFVGIISYSLYLWHWPILAFSNYWKLEEFSTLYKWSLVAASFVLAITSWRFVETPFRQKNIAGNRKKLFSYAMVTSSAFIVGGSLLISTNGFPERYGEQVQNFDRTKTETLHENLVSSPLSLKDAQRGDFPIFGKLSSKNIDVLVWGDSHAKSILPALIDAAGSSYTIGSAWHSSTAPVLDYMPPNVPTGYSLGDKSPDWSKTIVGKVAEMHIANVVLVARWSGYYKEALEESGKRDESIENFNKKFLKTVRSLRQAGAKVWVLREVPNHEVSVPKALIKEELFDTNIAQYKCTKAKLTEQNRIFDSLQIELELAGAIVLDASEFLFDEKAKKYRMEYGGVALYYDSHHLTKEGAEKVSEVFEPLFSDSPRKNDIVSKTDRL